MHLCIDSLSVNQVPSLQVQWVTSGGNSNPTSVGSLRKQGLLHFLKKPKDGAPVIALGRPPPTRPGSRPGAEMPQGGFIQWRREGEVRLGESEIKLIEFTAFHFFRIHIFNLN